MTYCTKEDCRMGGECLRRCHPVGVDASYSDFSTDCNKANGYKCVIKKDKPSKPTPPPLQAIHEAKGTIE